MEIKINVKEEHIINGKCEKARECAIALAVIDIIPEAKVYRCTIEHADKHGMDFIVAKLPPFVSDNIEQFDDFRYGHIEGKARLEHLKPFSFVVDVDESLLFPDKLLEEIEQIIEGSKNVELVTV